jgi:hypothetical protein
VTQKQLTVQCEVQIDRRQAVEGSSGQRYTETTDGAVWVNDRLWTDCRRQKGNSDSNPTDSIVGGNDRQWIDCRK